MDATRHLIDAVCEPLRGNHELHMQAVAELADAIGKSGAGEGEILAAAEKLERAKPRKFPVWATAVLAGILVGVSGLLVARPVMEYRRQFAQVEILFGFPLLIPRLAEKLPAKQKMFFEPIGGAAPRYEILWRSAPENPVYLSEHARSFTDTDLPDELLQHARKSDPENGFFDLLAAARLADTAIERDSAKAAGKRSDPSHPQPPRWRIKDEAKFTEALAKSREGIRKRKFQTYQREIFRERLAMVSDDGDILSSMGRTSTLLDSSVRIFPIKKIADLWSAAARRSAERKDVPGFREILADWENLAGKLTEDGNDLVDLLIVKMISSGADLHVSARELELEAEANRLQRLQDRLNAEKDQRDALFSTRLLEVRGSGLVGITMPMLARQVNHPRLPTADDLKPFRYAEFSLIERCMVIGGWLVLSVAAGLCALALFFRGKLTLELSASAARLVGKRDCVWIALVGIGIPIVWYVVFTRFTPLGAREYSPMFMKMVPAVGQFGALLLTIGIFPLVLAGSVLAKRGRVLVLGTRRGWIGWVAVMFAFACVPLFGAVSYVPEKTFIGFVTGIACVPLLWAVAGAFLHFFGNRGEALRRGILARLAWPVWLSAAVVLSLFTFAQHAEERHWLKRDRIFEMPDDSPGATQYENEIAETLRGELREILREFRAATS